MNKSSLPAALAAMTFACSTLAVRAQSPVIADGAKLENVGDGFKFTEGPTSDTKGDVYFTDQPNDRIVRYEFSSGKLTDWMKPCGRSNGLYFVAPDTLIACADSNNELWKITISDKTHELIAGDNAGKRFSGPNDCWVDASGAIYFTDPLYKRPYWTHEIPADNPRGVYRLSPDGALTKVAAELKQPNGIIGDAENRTLYVADIGAGTTYKYSIESDGTLGERTVFCKSGSDGMTIDVNRNIYLTGGKGVTVYDPDGELIETIGTGKRWTANVTFAGPNKDQLFITAGDSVFTIGMSVTGL